MPQAVRRRQQKTLNYSFNTTVSESLYRGMTYRELYLTLTGTLTLAAANNTVAKTKIGDEWAIIRNIRLTANGTTNLINCSAEALAAMQYYFMGSYPVFSETAAGVLQLGNAATLNPVIHSTLCIPVWMPKAVKPMDTLLDARKLSDLTIEIQWGSHTDINGDATAFSGQVVVNSLEAFGIAADAQFSSWRRFEIRQAVSAANERFQIMLPVGDLYRGFLINAKEAGPPISDSPAIINRLKLISGSTTYVDIDARTLQEMSIARGEHSLQYEDTILDRQVPFRISGDSDYRGWYWLDLCTDGRLSESIETLGLSEIMLELDVNAGTAPTIYVYPQQIVPVRKAAAVTG